MSRTKRIQSSTNTYHVMIRGINKQQIFYEPNDYKRMITILSRYKELSGYELYAYCLMGNHLHLLIKTGNEPIDRVIRRIGDSFVYWYNRKYDRCGHLFQDRFRSEPVEDERYLLTVFRYILQNPVVSGICDHVEDYPYSSAAEYLKPSNPISFPNITDTTFIEKILSGANLGEYLNHPEDTTIKMDADVRHRLSDEEAYKIIQKETVGLDAAPSYEDEHFIRSVFRKGVSIRQLSRLTGVSKYQIEKKIKHR